MQVFRGFASLVYGEKQASVLCRQSRVVHFEKRGYLMCDKEALLKK
nr:MAG TPA: hypothetical protein [Bacteriophage sp.]